MSENKLKTLPVELFYLPNLYQLAFKENDIEFIPLAITQSKKLKYLILKRNPIDDNHKKLLVKLLPDVTITF